MTDDEHKHWNEVDKQVRKQREVILTAEDVATFFAALDPALKVIVLDRGYEDDDLSQWYAYFIRFSVNQADDWIYELEDRMKKVETLREFRRKTMPWLHKEEE